MVWIEEGVVKDGHSFCVFKGCVLVVEGGYMADLLVGVSWRVKAYYLWEIKTKSLQNKILKKQYFESNYSLLQAYGLTTKDKRKTKWHKTQYFL